MKTVLAYELACMLDVPKLDVYTSTASLHCYQHHNGRVYRLDEALDALAAFYDRKISENEHRYEATHSPLYRTRADNNIARRERVLKKREEIGGERDED